jgi:hypothetical protein
MRYALLLVAALAALTPQQQPINTMCPVKPKQKAAGESHRRVRRAGHRLLLTKLSVAVRG